MTLYALIVTVTFAHSPGYSVILGSDWTRTDCLEVAYLLNQTATTHGPNQHYTCEAQ